MTCCSILIAWGAVMVLGSKPKSSLSAEHKTQFKSKKSLLGEYCQVRMKCIFADFSRFLFDTPMKSWRNRQDYIWALLCPYRKTPGAPHLLEKPPLCGTAGFSPSSSLVQGVPKNFNGGRMMVDSVARRATKMCRINDGNKQSNKSFSSPFKMQLSLEEMCRRKSDSSHTLQQNVF